MSIEQLKEKMHEINENMNSMSHLVHSTAVGQILLRKRLERMGMATEKEAFEKFSEANETAAEQALRNMPQSDAGKAFVLAQHLASVQNSPAPEGYVLADILATIPKNDHTAPLSQGMSRQTLNMLAKAADDLSVEESDVPDHIQTEDDPAAVTTIYEEPGNESPILRAESASSETEPKAATQESQKEHEQAIALGEGESFALDIILNEKQLAAKEMALSGRNYVLIGAAGTGKTTTQRAVAETLLEDKKLSVSRFKSYGSTGARQYLDCPSIAFVAYTRRAAANLAKAILKSPALAKALPNNIMTIHSLLEFEPETYWDDTEKKDKFRFAPMRTANNPLDITHLVIEESSMLGLDLWQQLYDALPVGVQIIFIGDINQLPPVFGPSILNYALVQLPIVELTQGYRNQGIVLENAWNILEGKPIKEDSHFVVMRGKNDTVIGQLKMSATLGAVFKQLNNMVDPDGQLEYDPEDCIILSPWNKRELGTDNMNKWIAQFLGDKRGAIVHEVIAGFNKLYLAEGDKAMFNKRDCVITKITRNANYFGREPQLPGSDLTRFGVRIIGGGKEDTLEDISLDYSNFSLEALENEKAERKQQATHVIRVTYDDGRFDDITGAGDLGEQTFSLGYALTVHKAQGSEWRKVFIILHKDHAVSLYRELFYTAVTRARTKVTIIAKNPTIEKAIKNQRIKGSSLQDKLEYFNGGAEMKDGIFTTKDF